MRRVALISAVATAALIAPSAASPAQAQVQCCWGSSFSYQLHHVDQLGWNNGQVCAYSMWYDDYGNWGYVGGAPHCV